MIDLNTLYLDKIVIHKIGNKIRGEEYQLSNTENDIKDANLRIVLERYFLQVFEERNTYHFFHDADLELNEVYHFTNSIFKDKKFFYEQSVNIAKHLYNMSDHPSIKSGDFYVVNFKDKNNASKVVGLFKVESKDTFLKVKKSEGNFLVTYDEGTNLSKIEKGCLIVNELPDEGYKVYIIDTLSKSEKNIAKYWKTNFLNVKLSQTNDIQTEQLIKINQNFTKEVFIKELSKEPFEIINFQKKTYEYINNKSDFDREEFLDKVLTSEDEKEKYRDYKKNFEKENGLTPFDNFEISPEVVKKYPTRIVSKIKLDTDVDINMRNTEFVEEGFDTDKNMKYFKIYYNHKR